MTVPAATTLTLDQADEAPGLARLAAAAEVKPGGAVPPPQDDGPLYAARRKIYPQSVSGTFRRIKWTLLVVTLGIYYLLPFVRWDRGPGAPHQAVLIDFPARRFYFFFIEIWPQEVYYITGLLILAALVLFLMNAVAGRIWCGYLCPQTVWTDLFFAIERWVEGDRRQQIRRDRKTWTLETWLRKGTKHFLWLMVAWWTGGAWVLYFADAPTLVKELATLQAPMVAYAFIGILTFTTYTLAGHMREQVCVYMCPWPRIQAALTDEYALNVTYRYDRGEPRCSASKAKQLRAQGQPAGDCVNCKQCVHVCPTGVDIREGADVACIQCGLCIDACNAMMAKLGRPPGLIAYDTDVNIKRRQEGKAPFTKLVRGRTMLYLGLIVVIGAIMLYSLATRHDLALAVIHDRNPLAVMLKDGSVRNGYTLRIINKRLQAREFLLSIDGPPGTKLAVFGIDPRADGRPVVKVGPDQTRELRATVTHKGPEKLYMAPITFYATDTASGDRTAAEDHFHGLEEHPQ